MAEADAQKGNEKPPRYLLAFQSVARISLQSPTPFIPLTWLFLWLPTMQWKQALLNSFLPISQSSFHSSAMCSFEILCHIDLITILFRYGVISCLTSIPIELQVLGWKKFYTFSPGLHLLAVQHRILLIVVV